MHNFSPLHISVSFLKNPLCLALLVLCFHSRFEVPLDVYGSEYRCRGRRRAEWFEALANIFNKL